MPTPKIGQLIKLNVPRIIEHCESTDPGETNRLSDTDYCREVLGLGWPFFKTPAVIEKDAEHKRYWIDTHEVGGQELRVTSQWFARHMPRFVRYLLDKGITPIGLSEAEVEGALAALADSTTASKNPGGARYRLHAIGNAQNSWVRYVLGNIGHESFTEKDWLQVKGAFGFRCAYCGSARHLVMDHAVPISIDSLGEHRLGNLVPACSACNSAKSDQRYDAFARSSLSAEDADIRIAAIETHMARHGYEPLVRALSATGVTDAQEVLRRARQQIADIAFQAIRDVNAVASSGN